jgi:alkylated DNA repair dioxygenase AlkB
MNFNLIKRKFDIKSGSYILWTGEPSRNYHHSSL